MNTLPTRPGPNDDLTAAVAMFLLNYESSSDSDRAKQAQLDLYKKAVDGLPEWCVREAAENFLKGKVEGVNTEFRPKTGTFGKEARRILGEEAKRQKITESARRAERERLKEIRAERERQKYLGTPEGKAERERVARRMEDLRHALSAASVAMSALPPHDDSAIREYKGKPVAFRSGDGRTYISNVRQEEARRAKRAEEIANTSTDRRKGEWTQNM